MYVPSTGGENSRYIDIQGVPKTDENIEATIREKSSGSRAQIKSNQIMPHQNKAGRQADRQAGKQ